MTVHDLEVYRCGSCGEISVDDAADARVSSAFLDAARLLHPAQIKAKRERLGLIQKDLAELIGISPSMVNRWENGVQIQQRTIDWSMRILFAIPQAKSFAEMLRRGDALAYQVLSHA